MKYLKSGISCKAAPWLAQYNEYLKESGSKATTDLKQIAIYQEIVLAETDYGGAGDDGKKAQIESLVDLAGTKFKTLIDDGDMNYIAAEAQRLKFQISVRKLSILIAYGSQPNM